MTAVPDDDRLLPADPATRAVARRLYDSVRAAPIISPHGHVDPRLLLADQPFPDPTALLITPDHYLTRILHAHGVSLDALGLGPDPGPPRAAWRALARLWPRLAGTTVRYWLEDQFAAVFELSRPLSAATAEESYDELAARLAEPRFRPRALLDRFGVQVLATTDDPADDLSAHAALNEDGRGPLIVPTFRPDRYLDPSAPAWAGDLGRLAAAADVDCATASGLVTALAARRRAFAAAGATSIDVSAADAWIEPLSPAEAERIHRDGRAGPVRPEAALVYRRHLLWELARQSTEDGLVMQLHAGVLRDHHGPTRARYGSDSGSDLPLPVEFTRPLRRVLSDFGTDPNLHLIVFTLDEAAFGRDLAPLAGFYPSVFVGAPWWFLDTPEAILRFRRAVTDSAGFHKTSGFVDDTRALCSIPTRHDLSRRTDAAFLAELVVGGRLGEDEAAIVAADLVDAIPRAAFKLAG